jgi:hypothetical protein
MLLGEIIRECVFEVFAASSVIFFLPDAIPLTASFVGMVVYPVSNSLPPIWSFPDSAFFYIVIEAQNSSTKTRSSRGSGMEWEIVGEIEYKKNGESVTLGLSKREGSELCRQKRPAGTGKTATVASPPAFKGITSMLYFALH